MKTASLLSMLSVTATTLATTVSYDTGYDDASRSMNVVACSDGQNGLITRYGWQTQGQIGWYPHIGGSSDVAGYNSPNCGECLSVTWNGKTIHVLIIDHAGAGVNMGKRAMDDLTGGQAEHLGRIDAKVKKVPISQCGLTHSKREMEFTA